VRPQREADELETNLWLCRQAVVRLSELLEVVAAAPGTGDELRYQLDYCRNQVGELMPAVEVLVLAGVLREATDRPGPVRNGLLIAIADRDRDGSPSSSRPWPSPSRDPPAHADIAKQHPSTAQQGACRGIPDGSHRAALRSTP
jgi:hypothetical protein